MVHVDTSISKFCNIGIDCVCVLVGNEYLSLPDTGEPVRSKVFRKGSQVAYLPKKLEVGGV